MAYRGWERKKSSRDNKINSNQFQMRRQFQIKSAKHPERPHSFGQSIRPKYVKKEKCEKEQCEDDEEHEEDDDLVFRQVTGKRQQPTRYCFHKGHRFAFRRIQNDGGRKYECTHMRSVHMAHCPAIIVVYYDEEEKKDDSNDMEYKSYTFTGPHNGTFLGNGHEIFDDGDIALMDFRQDVRNRIDAGVQVHEAYHDASLYNPRVAEELVMGFESIRNMAYRHARKDGTAMPHNPALIGKYLKDRGLDGNIWDQMLKREGHLKSTTPEQIGYWKKRAGKFYLGDGGTHGQMQFWCPEMGAKELSTGYRVYIDVSYRITPKVARMQRPYGGVLHILAGHRNKDNEWVPQTTPCATILLKDAKPSGQVYLNALVTLKRLCWQQYKIDIRNDTERSELITMADMERGLREAVQGFWPLSKKKICAFHFAQALLKNQKSTDIGLFKHCKDNTRIYYYFRNFFVLWAVPPGLVGRCYELLIRKGGDPEFGYKDVCPEEGHKWLEYFRTNYMKNPDYAMAWNHWWSWVRTNNELENRNGKINKMFGAHPYINKFAFRLAKWYGQEYLQLEQYIKQGYQRKRRTSEVLKNKLLEKCWKWLEELGKNPTDDQLIIFVKYCSVAVNGDKKKLKEILARPEFWKK